MTVPSTEQQLAAWRSKQAFYKALWGTCRTPTAMDLLQAGIHSRAGLRERHGNIMCPLRDLNGELWTVMAISRYRRIGFIGANARVQGLFFHYGESFNDQVVITLHVWDAGVLHEDLGCPVVAAILPDNLETVARAIKEANPFSDIVIWAREEEDEPAARRAAAALGVRFSNDSSGDVFNLSSDEASHG